MRIILGNISSTLVVGGVDNLLPYDLFQVMREHLREHPEDYHRVPAYNRRNKDGTRQYDGYHYFLTKKGIFPTGILPAVLAKANSLNVQVILEDQRGVIPAFKAEFDDYVGYIDGKDWMMNGKREYQADIVKKGNNYIDYNGAKIYFPRGIVDAATNGGKNSIMVGLVNNVEDSKAIMLIHSVKIFAQAYAFFSKAFKSVGRIDSTHYELGKFTVAMQKSLLNKMKKSVNVRNDMQKFNMVFIDEGHRITQGEYMETLINIPAPIRYLVSGTSLDSKDKVDNISRIGISGPILASITNEQLIDMGVSLPPKVHMLLNRGGSGMYNTYDDEHYNVVKFSQDRMKVMADFLAGEEYIDKFTLIVFDEIAHGNFILKYFRDDPRFKGLVIELTHGQDKASSFKLERFAEGKIDILICNTIAQEGLNIPNIQTMVYAIGGSSKTRLKQFVGRLVRDDGESDSVTIVDFYDVGRWVDEHSRTRLRLYKAEKFEKFHPITYHYDADAYGKPKALRGLPQGFAIK